MYGMPTGGMGPTGFDPSMLMLTGYMLGMLTGLIALALVVGLFTLPVFFIVLFVVQFGVQFVAERTGTFSAKLVLIMFRGLLRSPLRTSLTYLALFILTLVLSLIYSVLNFISLVTTEKEANFKAIVTHKTVVPSQMPRAHYERFKELCRKPARRACARKRATTTSWPGRSCSAPPIRSPSGRTATSSSSAWSRGR